MYLFVVSGGGCWCSVDDDRWGGLTRAVATSLLWLNSKIDGLTQQDRTNFKRYEGNVDGGEQSSTIQRTEKELK